MVLTVLTSPTNLAMDDYSPLSSPTFSLGGSSVASSIGSPRQTSALRRLTSMFSKRDRKLTLKDIEKAIRRAQKSSEAAQRQRKALGDTLFVWVSQSADERYRDIAAKLHENLMPLWSPDANNLQQVTDILSKIDILKSEEAQRDRLQDEYRVAEKMLFRGKFKGLDPVDLEPLERGLQILRVQAESAEARYRRSSGRLLYLSLHGFLAQTETSSGLNQLACQNALKCLREQNDTFSETCAFTPNCFDQSSLYPESPVDRSEEREVVGPSVTPGDRGYEVRDELLERAMHESSIVCPEFATPFDH